MVTLKFERYFIERFSFKENENFETESDTLDVDFFPNVEINILEDDSSAVIFLNCKLGDETKKNCPFTGEVSLTGIFECEFNKDDVEDMSIASELLTQNSISILFPYLRSFISDMTLRTNKFPAFILPPFNIIDMLKNEDLIKINRLSSN